MRLRDSLAVVLVLQTQNGPETATAIQSFRIYILDAERLLPRAGRMRASLCSSSIRCLVERGPSSSNNRQRQTRESGPGQMKRDVNQPTLRRRDLAGFILLFPSLSVASPAFAASPLGPARNDAILQSLKVRTRGCAVPVDSCLYVYLSRFRVTQSPCPIAEARANRAS